MELAGVAAAFSFQKNKIMKSSVVGGDLSKLYRRNFPYHFPFG
jgi:hypothetical protein